MLIPSEQKNGCSGKCHYNHSSQNDNLIMIRFMGVRQGLNRFIVLNHNTSSGAKSLEAKNHASLHNYYYRK